MPRTALPGEAKEGEGWAFFMGSVMLRATQESQLGDADAVAGGARREAFWVNLEARALADSQGRRCEWLSSRVGGRRPGRTSGDAAVMGPCSHWGHPREDVPTMTLPQSILEGAVTQEPGPQTRSSWKVAPRSLGHRPVLRVKSRAPGLAPRVARTGSCRKTHALSAGFVEMTSLSLSAKGDLTKPG